MKKITPKAICTWVPQREDDSYKGDYGKVLIIAGSKRYGGAAIMAAEACVKSGAGLVTVATDAVNRPALHSRLPECMFLDHQELDSLRELVPTFDVILIGPGLDRNELANELLTLTLQTAGEEQKVILDGDALFLYSKQPTKTKAALIFTPHLGEWEYLQTLTNEDSNAGRAEELGGIVVLKSNRTTVYTPDGGVWQNIYGTPAMATGGMGDTLAGMIAGMIGQTEKFAHGVLAAVFLHSYIGEILAKKRYVVLPTEIAASIPTYLKIFSEMEEQL
ncbi:NAD(P)H-hydrate dehydratase [Listeria grayi]|nr:NAD(P)H-hydrate dehydratase [Listeria grayi]